MEKQFVPYELAVKLKELGFDEPCLATFHTKSKSIIKIYGEYKGQPKPHDKTNSYWILAPLWQQVFDWFRDKHNLLGNVYANASGYLFEIHHSANKGGSHQHDSGFDGPNDSGCWDKYFDARVSCIEKLIELLTKNN